MNLRFFFFFFLFAFLFSEVGDSFRLGCFCLLILDLSDIALLSRSLFVSWCVSSISRSENQSFFINFPTWSASLWLVIWKLTPSYQISIILFLNPLCVGLLLKQQCRASWLSYLVHVLCLCLWSVWFFRLSFVYLKKEPATFVGWRSGLPCWLSGEHLPIMTSRPVAWVPPCVIFWFNVFIMGGILWLYQARGLFKIYTPDTDVTSFS